MNLVMMGTTVRSLTPSRTNATLKLAFSLWVVVLLHVGLLILLHPNAVAVSRSCTAATAMLTTLCLWHRAQLLPAEERGTWYWGGAGILLWAVAHAVETLLGSSTAASNLAVDPSDFLYITAAFPLLLAFSTTRQTASLRTVFYLNWVQISLAFVLTYFRLYRMALPPEAAATVMGRIYAADCALLVVLAAMRYFTCKTREERRSIGLVVAFLLIYMPVEIGMDFATARWGLKAGSLLDLLWSIPFVFAGWKTLNMPKEEAAEDFNVGTHRSRALVETLCPMLISVGVFALAASVASQHLALALAAMFLMLVLHGIQAGMLQLSYRNGQALLLEREHELRAANEALEQLSLLDPLTCVANRRRLDTALELAWQRAVRNHQSVSLLILDVDHFKQINDRHGHKFGDECLVTVAQAIALEATRPDDLLARYGGDEFLLLLPDTDSRGAYSVAERIHNVVRQLPFGKDAPPSDRGLTVSIGIGAVHPKLSEDPESLVEIADHALYDAKRLGRNRTCSRTHGDLVALAAQA